MTGVQTCALPIYKKAIEAGISVYNRSKGKPIVNSADAGGRIENIDLAAANDAIVIALCSAEGIAADNDERMMHCQNMLERGMAQGMDTICCHTDISCKPQDNHIEDNSYDT